MQDWEHRDLEVDSENYAKSGLTIGRWSLCICSCLESRSFVSQQPFPFEQPCHPVFFVELFEACSLSPWTDCRSTAAWRSQIWSAADWAREHPEAHPFVRMEGAGLNLVYPDMMIQRIWAAFPGQQSHLVCAGYLPGTVAANLEIVWAFIQDWFKDHAPQGCTPEN